MGRDKVADKDKEGWSLRLELTKPFLEGGRTVPVWPRSGLNRRSDLMRGLT
jgi:hypothetical protein